MTSTSSGCRKSRLLLALGASSQQHRKNVQHIFASTAGTSTVTLLRLRRWIQTTGAAIPRMYVLCIGHQAIVGEIEPLFSVHCQRLRKAAPSSLECFCLPGSYGHMQSLGTHLRSFAMRNFWLLLFLPASGFGWPGRPLTRQNCLYHVGTLHHTTRLSL